MKLYSTHDAAMIWQYMDDYNTFYHLFYEITEKGYNLQVLKLELINVIILFEMPRSGDNFNMETSLANINLMVQKVDFYGLNCFPNC